MKPFFSFISVLLSTRSQRRNTVLMVRFLILLLVIMLLLSCVFRYFMHLEGRNFSWVTSFYWIYVTMSTLGYGDITFNSQTGHLFTVIVSLLGFMCFFVVFPFAFIQFFYAPWAKMQSAARTPRELPEDMTGHVLFTHWDPVVSALIKKFEQYKQSYTLIVPDAEEALRLHDENIQVLVGYLDNPETYQKARIGHAVMVVTTATDAINTNVGFTVRELSQNIPIIATASNESAVDVLLLAGISKVLRLGEMMGRALARRTIGGDALAHEIGHFEELCIAEATIANTPLVGKTLAESRLRELAGVNVVGIWERGSFELAEPNTRLAQNTVLILAGSREQLNQYNELLCIYHQSENAVVIVGGGRVGRATGRALKERGIPYHIIDNDPARVKNLDNAVLGDASDFEILEAAGFNEASAIIITTHDDDINIYLTIYCRKLRPDIQIISRSIRDRNVSSLHRAGADFVMSYASMGANAILNALNKSGVLMVAEGLSVFRVKVPEALKDKSLQESRIREETGCSIVALRIEEKLQINPSPDTVLKTETEMFVIGNADAEGRFLSKYNASILDNVD